MLEIHLFSLKLTKQTQQIKRLYHERVRDEQRQKMDDQR